MFSVFLLVLSKNIENFISLWTAKNIILFLFNDYLQIYLKKNIYLILPTVFLNPPKSPIYFFFIYLKGIKRAYN